MDLQVSSSSSEKSSISFIEDSLFSSILNFPMSTTLFTDYLFNDEWTKDGEASKFEQIVETLREIRTKRDPDGIEYKDYNIYVTGHR